MQQKASTRDSAAQGLRRDLDSLAAAVGSLAAHFAPSSHFELSPLASLGTASRPEQDLFKSTFTQRGSDKATTHSYHEAYPIILSYISPISRVIEIGIGARQPSPDNQGGWPGEAGGSLHAWSAITNGAEILGLDIDPRMDESSPNIQTMPLNSLDLESQKSVSQAIAEHGKLYDLIVDDGLHVPEAQVNNMLHFFSLVRPKGLYVVEDVHESIASALCEVARMLGSCHIFEYSQRSGGWGEDNCLIAVQQS